MAEIRREAYFGKLNKLSFNAIDSATIFCKLRGNPNVELVHWIHQLLQLQDSDLHRILRHFACDPARVAEGKQAESEIERQFMELNARLDGVDYFCGDFTAADIAMFMTVLFVQRLKGPRVSAHPRLAATDAAKGIARSMEGRG